MMSNHEESQTQMMPKHVEGNPALLSEQFQRTLLFFFVVPQLRVITMIENNNVPLADISYFYYF